MVTLANIGAEQLARLAAGATTSTHYFGYMSIGTGNITEDAAHTALHQEITSFGGRKAATHYYTASGGHKGVWNSSWGFNAATVVNEFGVFVNLASSASMLARHKFSSAKNLASGESLSLILYAEFS